MWVFGIGIAHLVCIGVVSNELAPIKRPNTQGLPVLGNKPSPVTIYRIFRFGRSFIYTVTGTGRTWRLATTVAEQALTLFACKKVGRGHSLCQEQARGEPTGKWTALDSTLNSVPCPFSAYSEQGPTVYCDCTAYEMRNKRSKSAK